MEKEENQTTKLNLRSHFGRLEVTGTGNDEFIIPTNIVQREECIYVHVNLLVASYSQWSFLHPTHFTDKDHYCQDNTSMNFDTISRKSCNFCQHIWPNINAGLSYHSALIPSTTDPLVPFNCALHSASYANQTLGHIHSRWNIQEPFRNLPAALYWIKQGNSNNSSVCLSVLSPKYCSYWKTWPRSSNQWLGLAECSTSVAVESLRWRTENTQKNPCHYLQNSAWNVNQRRWYSLSKTALPQPNLE